MAYIQSSSSNLDEMQPTVKKGNTYADYLAYVLEKGTTPNGVFGTKLMWGYLDDFVSSLRSIPAYQSLPVPELLATIFPDLHYISVTRNDKVRQAVSLWKAIQTSTWRADAFPSGTKHASTHKDLMFNFVAIDHLLQRIVAHEAAWQNYFAENNIQPLTIVYEELSSAYEEAAYTILKYLDIPIPETLMFAERRMKRQADEISEEWVRLYYQHAAY